MPTHTTVFIVAASALVSLVLTGCDANRKLRQEVTELAEIANIDRQQCRQAEDLESRDAGEQSSLRRKIYELEADKEWDGIVQTGAAGTQELLIQAKRTMADPSYKSSRDREIIELNRQLKLFAEDGPRRQKDRQVACAAMLKSIDAYMAAKASLAAADAQAKR
ncbi:TPA: hypothetical protein UL935_002792 [Stenotrophomonas maltophilia]|nr:hypothetical protein [Stenotrophomonas maltophilia]